MNVEMWLNPANNGISAQLVSDGITVYMPGLGEQACGENVGKDTRNLPNCWICFGLVDIENFKGARKS